MSLRRSYSDTIAPASGELPPVPVDVLLVVVVDGVVEVSSLVEHATVKQVAAKTA